MRTLWAILLVLCAPLVLSSQGNPDQVEVKGTVVNSVTGEPVSAALLTIDTVVPEPDDATDASARLMAPTPTEKKIVTDSTGRFTFVRRRDAVVTNLTVMKNGFEPFFQFAQAMPAANPAANLGSKPSDDQTLVVKLVPHAVVHGRVVNEDGEPIPNIHVELLSVTVRDGRRQTTVERNMNTNDLGEYRFYDLKAGRFYARAGGRSQNYSSGLGLSRLVDSDSTFANLYYPTSTRLDAAEPFPLLPGQELIANFRLREQRAFRIRGQLKGFSPPPGSRPALRLLVGDEALANRTLFQTNGAFEVSDVTPGSYTLQAYSAGGDPRLGEAQVTLADHDVTGVDIALVPAQEVRGAIVFAGVTSRSPRANIQALARSSGIPPNLMARNFTMADANGQFSLKLFPGVYDLQVNAGGYYLASLQAGDKDVLAEGLSVGASGVGDLRIMLNAGGAQIKGTLEDAPTGPASFVQVLLLRKMGNSVVPRMVPGFQGKFVAADLPPGEYIIAAVAQGQEIEYRNPSVLQNLSGTVSLLLRDAATEEVTLKMVRDKP